jgi:hypothetical protein
MELFAASSGSSMRSVLGTHSDFSSLSSFSGLESLECFPRVGDPLPEQLLLLDPDGDMQPLVPIHGVFHAAAGQLGKQPQTAGGTSGYGNAGAGNLEPGIMGEFIQGAELVLQLSDGEADCGILPPGTITGRLFHPMLQGYMKGGAPR